MPTTTGQNTQLSNPFSTNYWDTINANFNKQYGGLTGNDQVDWLGRSGLTNQQTGTNNNTLTPFQTSLNEQWSGFKNMGMGLPEIQNIWQTSYGQPGLETPFQDAQSYWNQWSNLPTSMYSPTYTPGITDVAQITDLIPGQPTGGYRPFDFWMSENRGENDPIKRYFGDTLGQEMPLADWYNKATGIGEMFEKDIGGYNEYVNQWNTNNPPPPVDVTTPPAMHDVDILDFAKLTDMMPEQLYGSSRNFPFWLAEQGGQGDLMKRYFGDIYGTQIPESDWTGQFQDIMNRFQGDISDYYTSGTGEAQKNLLGTLQSQAPDDWNSWLMGQYNTPDYNLSDMYGVGNITGAMKPSDVKTQWEDIMGQFQGDIGEYYQYQREQTRRGAEAEKEAYLRYLADRNTGAEVTGDDGDYWDYEDYTPTEWETAGFYDEETYNSWLAEQQRLTDEAAYWKDFANRTNITPSEQVTQPPTQPGTEDAYKQLYDEFGNIRNELSNTIMERLRNPYQGATPEQMEAQYKPYFNELDKQWADYERSFLEAGNRAGALGSGRLWESLGKQGYGVQQARENMMSQLVSQDIDRQLNEQSKRVQEAMGMSAQTMNDWLNSESMKLNIDKFQLAREMGIDDQTMKRIELEANLESQQINDLQQIINSMFNVNQTEMNQILQALAGQQGSMQNVGGMGFQFQPLTNPYAVNQAGSQLPYYDFGKYFADIIKG